jgi:HEAT repeat protein
MKTKQLLEDLAHGNASAAFEAAKTLSNLPRLSAKQIIEVLDSATDVPNREAVVYVLSWLCRKDNHDILQALIKIASDPNEHPAVRGQAFEGLGIQKSTKRSKFWPDIERVILDGLRDHEVEVRFWACYAAGSLRMKSALPQLQELADNDSAIYPSWWPVSEEAADAIEWIFGKSTEARMRMNAQNDRKSEVHAD